MTAMTYFTVEEILAELKVSDRPVLELLEHYQHDDYKKLWRADPRLYRAFAKNLIDRDHPSRAYELAREALQTERHPHDRRLEYLAALALARSSNVSKATELADKLLAAPGLDDSLKSDALSLQGRLQKDLYQRTGDVAFAKKSAEYYGQAFKVKRDWFPGINAATMSLLAGDERKGRHLAGAVIGLVSEDYRQPGEKENYWLLATLGEAHMVRGEMEAARQFYDDAVKKALREKDEGSVASMRRQVQLVAKKLPDVKSLLDVFHLGNIVVFAGHLLDHPSWIVKDDYPMRFPSADELVSAVREAIAAKLNALDARVGYSGAACGADLLFCEELLKRGGTLHVVLPFDKNDFYRTSVDFGLPDVMAPWRERCDKVLEKAFEVHYATRDRFLGDEILFEYGNSFAQGLAMIRAARVGLSPIALCLLDENSKGSVGTADFVRRFQSRGGRVELIDLAEIRAATSFAAPEPEFWRQALKRQEPEPERLIHRDRRAMLFADVKNYSQIKEERAPDFFIRYLDEVSGLLTGAQIKTMFANTWGDGLFLVFEDALDCADAALQLVERIEKVDWSKYDLPPDTTMRVGVHYGPVYEHFDKIIGRENFFGGQVNRTARIEPVTTPGCVFASEQFAAELAVRSDHDYVTEYVGVEELAKSFDRCALYRIAHRYPLQTAEAANERKAN